MKLIFSTAKSYLKKRLFCLSSEDFRHTPLREGLHFLPIQFNYYSPLSANYPSWSSELLAVLLQQLSL